jgi:hypothetical protein
MKVKSDLLTQLEKMSKDLTSMDTRYLLGQVPKKEYKQQRKRMKLKFYGLKKIFGV